MNASRIIRVGTRIYVKRIAVVSQEHVPVCINTQNNTGRQRHGLSVGIEIDLVVVWVVEMDLISVWGIGIDLISVYGSELAWLCVGSTMSWF